MPNTNNGIMQSQYSAPMTPHQMNQHASHSLYICSSGHGSTQNIPDTHKSMWAINPLCISNGGNVLLINKSFDKRDDFEKIIGLTI